MRALGLLGDLALGLCSYAVGLGGELGLRRGDALGGRDGPGLDLAQAAIGGFDDARLVLALLLELLAQDLQVVRKAVLGG